MTYDAALSATYSADPYYGPNVQIWTHDIDPEVCGSDDVLWVWAQELPLTKKCRINVTLWFAGQEVWSNWAGWSDSDYDSFPSPIAETINSPNTYLYPCTTTGTTVEVYE
jgi:hypothetical protein